MRDAYLAKSARDDALQLVIAIHALHGEGLARTGLAVGEDRPVVPLQHAVHDVRRRLRIEVRLRRVRRIDCVECKGFGLIALGLGLYDAGAHLLVHEDDLASPIALLLAVERPAAHDDLDGLRGSHGAETLGTSGAEVTSYFPIIKARRGMMRDGGRDTEELR